MQRNNDEDLNPVKAYCSRKYNNTYYDSAQNTYYYEFKVLFPNTSHWRFLQVQVTEEDKPIAYSLDYNKFETWQENSWQNALFVAFKRNAGETNTYVEGNTKEIIYELSEKSTGEYCYLLRGKSKTIAQSNFAGRFWMYNMDGSILRSGNTSASDPEPAYFNNKKKLI